MPLSLRLRPCDRVLYGQRHRVENFFAKLEDWRPIATPLAGRQGETLTAASGTQFVHATVSRVAGEVRVRDVGEVARGYAPR